VTEVQSGRREGIRWFPRCVIAKYSPGQVAWARARLEGRPLDGVLLSEMFREPEEGTVTDSGNGVVASGVANLVLVLTGRGGYPLAPGYAVFGVGSDGHTGFTRDQASLSHAEGEHPERSFYLPMDPGFPGVPRPGVIEGQATFTERDACFPWREWCWAAGARRPQPHHELSRVFPDGQHAMMNRKASPAGYGTKETGAAWVFKTEIQIG
jgi:hypothetical protein